MLSIDKALLSTLFLFCAFFTPIRTVAFSSTTSQQNLSPTRTSKFTTTRIMSNKSNNDNNNKKKKAGGNVFDDIKGMFTNFDDVVDDFLFKRMGAGEQWYGKRKYNPSGKFDGNYNGMGRSDFYRIEIAKIQKEEMEKRRQRRLIEEEEARK